MELEEENLCVAITTNPSPNAGKTPCQFKTLEYDDEEEKTHLSMTFLMVSKQKKGKSLVKITANKSKQQKMRGKLSVSVKGPKCHPLLLGQSAVSLGSSF